MRFREAGDGVEKEFLAFVRVLQSPGFAAVGRFVDARFFAFAAGHDVGSGSVERHDAAKVERVAASHVQALPRRTPVDRFQNHAVRTGRPNNRRRYAFCVRPIGQAHAAQIGSESARLHLPPLSLGRNGDEHQEQECVHSAHFSRGRYFPERSAIHLRSPLFLLGKISNPGLCQRP